MIMGSKISKSMLKFPQKVEKFTDHTSYKMQKEIDRSKTKTHKIFLCPIFGDFENFEFTDNDYGTSDYVPNKQDLNK